MLRTEYDEWVCDWCGTKGDYTEFASGAARYRRCKECGRITLIAVYTSTTSTEVVSFEKIKEGRRWRF